MGGERLHRLDAAVIQYMRQLLGDGFDVTDGHNIVEHWKSGSPLTELEFDDTVSNRDVERFQRNYSFYLENSSKCSLDAEGMCFSRVGRLVHSANCRNEDLGVRFIEGSVVVCGSQSAVDRDLGSIEYDLVSGTCSPGCHSCGSSRGGDHGGKAEAAWGGGGGKKFGGGRGDKRGHRSSHHGHDSGGAPGREDRQFIKVSEGLSIQVYKANLTEVRVDGIVNTTNKHLSLLGPLSKSIVKRGGQRIAEELEQYQNRPLDACQVVDTSGGELPCTYVLHVNLEPGENPASSVRRAVLEVLRKAQQLHLSSVAMPALGSGKLGVKTEDAAKAILDAVEEFGRERRASSSLREVHLVDMMSDSAYELRKHLCKAKGIPFEERGFFTKFKDRVSKTFYS